MTRTKARPKHWKRFWNDELQRKADLHEEAYKRWCQSPNIITVRAALWNKYTLICDEFTKEIRCTQRQIWKQFCSKLGNAPVNEANSTIKQIRKNRNSTHSFSHPEGPEKAVEDMATHLSSVFGGERTSDTSLPFMDINTDDSPFLAIEIEVIINKMAPRKAPSYDHLTGGMLKPISKPLSNTLSKFFQFCWNWSWNQSLGEQHK